jgi:hypothetical protein
MFCGVRIGDDATSTVPDNLTTSGHRPSNQKNTIYCWRLIVGHFRLSGRGHADWLIKNRSQQILPSTHL